MTIGELVERYLGWRAIAGAEPSVRAYRNDLRKLRNFIGEDSPPEDLNVFGVHRFLLQLHKSGLATKSVARTLACVKSLVKWACAEGIYKENFAAVVKGPRIPQKLPKVPTAEEMNAMCEGGFPTSWPERDRLAIELLYCDARVGELVAIDLADRVAPTEIIVKGKGKKERKILLTPPAQKAIALYLPSRASLLKMRGVTTDSLFVNLKTARRLTVRSVGRIVKAIARAKGLPEYISPHRLRAACASHMLENGAPISTVRQLLGHSKYETTMAYCGRINPRRVREAYDRTYNR